MSTDAKELIRERLDLVEVIGEVVALKPAGRGQFKGLCPFHEEKTPSFHVHRDRGFYYCFGCQAKGDLFDFVMQTRRLSFPEALKMLGDRAGVQVEPASSQSNLRRDLRAINELALAHFRSALLGPPLDYLLGRGLTRDSIEAFELGYAGAEWDGLLRAALTKGVDSTDLVKLGLAAESATGRLYDRFRERVIFPIRDQLGRLVGFAGRVLGDAKPKYMNSPESELFHKGELLYGLNVARSIIRESGEAILVEGYVDVIALHQAGFSNAVATLGTALTAGHAGALERLNATRLHLAFDSDEAGQRAMLAGLDQSASRSFLVTAVTVPEGEDPADVVLSGRAEEFRDALTSGLSEVEFRFQRVLELHDRESVEGQRAILEELKGTLQPRAIFDPVAQEMRRLVTEHLKMDASRLDEWLRASGTRATSLTEVRGMRQRRVQVDQRRRLELEMIALLLLEPAKLEARLAELGPELEAGDPASPLTTLPTHARALNYDVNRLLATYRDLEEAALVFERLFGEYAQGVERIDVERQLKRSLSRLREYELEYEKERTRNRLAERRDELTRLLGGEGLSELELKGIYGELQEIQALLAARDAERRLRVPESFGRRRRR